MPIDGAPSPATQPGLAARLGAAISRLLFGLCGLGLLAGFFMPWIVLGQLAAVTGLGLTATSGELGRQLSGAHRAMLYLVPGFGGALLVSAILGLRITMWIAAFTGVAILGCGVYTAISVFFSSTGIGMWLVVGAAALALAVAIVTIGLQPAPRA